MNNIIPLISSGTTGPLGVLHLPRLWQKASLGAAGKLHADYPACGQGYDQMVLDGLGLDRAAFLAFIDTKPSYLECEAWVKEHGTKLDQASVEALNAAITGYVHTDEVCAEILPSVGLAAEAGPRDAVNLNNLDDWQGFYNELIK